MSSVLLAVSSPSSAFLPIDTSMLLDAWVLRVLENKRRSLCFPVLVLSQRYDAMRVCFLYKREKPV